MPRSGSVTTARPSATARQLRLLSEGTATVNVRQPIEPAIPPNTSFGWSLERTDGRPSFVRQAQPIQAIRVTYQVFEDPLQLADLAERAARNRSGQAIRGYATCQAGHAPQHNLTPSLVLGLIQHAANNDSHRVVEGPVSVRVRLLEQPQGAPPRCIKCKATLAEHEVVQKTSQGDWGDWSEGLDSKGRGRGVQHWDPTRERTDTYYLCPQAAQS